MSKVLIFVLISFLPSCISEQPHDFIFNQIDYSFDSGWEDALSLRLNEDGDCIIAKGTSKNKQYFRGKVDVKTLLEIDSIYRKTLICNPGSVYEENIADAGGYKVVSGEKSFHVYGRSEPTCLTEFSNALRKLAETELTPIDTAIAFKSLQSFYPPEVKLDSSKFLPPTHKTER